MMEIMLQQVLRRMTPSCLKKAVLVDRRWRDVGQDPALWEWCKVAVYTEEDVANLSIKRLENVQELHVSHDNWDTHNWEAFLGAVEKLSSLEKIEGLDWDSGDRNIANSDLLARSLAKLEDVSVDDLDYDHIRALFTQMSSASQVKTFHLKTDANLSQMEAELFASALSGVEDLTLSVGRVIKDQVQAFFTGVLNNRSLKSLDLPAGDFCQKIWRHLKPGFLASVLSTVEDVSLQEFGDISSDHMKALFAELSAGAQLKRLGLSFINLSDIGAALLSNALSRLEELRLGHTSISTGQIQALFSQMSLRTQMKKLALWLVDLSQLEQGLLARVMARLEDLDLSCCDITTDQVQELFKEMSSNNHLQSLAINSIDLSPVHPKVFSKVLSRLETVKLGSSTTMTTEQAVALFSEMSRTSVMKNFGLNLDWHHDPISWDLSSVNPNVLASALVRLEEVDLRGFHITDHQATAFCREMSQNGHLKELNLRGINFYDINAEVLAAAVTNVKEVFLDDCHLSEEQIYSVFHLVLDGENKLKNLSLNFTDLEIPQVDQEMARKVKEKLKGRLVTNIIHEDSDSDGEGEGSGDDDNDEDNNDDYDDYDDYELSSPGSGTVSEEEMEDLDEDAADNESESTECKEEYVGMEITEGGFKTEKWIESERDVANCKSGVEELIRKHALKKCSVNLLKMQIKQA